MGGVGWVDGMGLWVGWAQQGLVERSRAGAGPGQVEWVGLGKGGLGEVGLVGGWVVGVGIGAGWVGMGHSGVG